MVLRRQSKQTHLTKIQAARAIEICMTTAGCNQLLHHLHISKGFFYRWSGAGVGVGILMGIPRIP